MGRAENAIRFNHLSAAAAWGDEVLAMPQEMVALWTQIMAHGARALAREATDRAAALAAAGQGLALFEGLAMDSYWSLEAYATVADVFMRGCEAGDTTWRGAARKACKPLRRMAFVFPLARPRAYACSGVLAWLDGRHFLARRLWNLGLSAARRLHMPFEQALAHYELGRHSHGADGRYHLERGKKEGGNSGGLFSLVLEKTDKGWKIIVDHTTG
jgi:hypothetical protein